MRNDHPTEPEKPGLRRCALRTIRLLTAFINADLPSRVGLDARKSIVLYDKNYLFNYALDRLPNERTLGKLYHQTPVRYWSKDDM